jgi:flagellar biosynthesis anti-sigma factor FlgM
LPIVFEAIGIDGHNPLEHEMKIDGKQYTQQAQDTDAAEAAKRLAADQAAKRTGAKTTTSSRDRVEVSSDAQLLATALNATQKAPEVRTELVERLRVKLNAGEIGNDAGKLADRMIDDLLNK